QGFQVLVESDWLDFGHKFGDRCGHQEKVEDQNEQCPVFLQWLDAVHQLLKQFPCLFEFNEAFLVSSMHRIIESPRLGKTHSPTIHPSPMVLIKPCPSTQCPNIP
ncbi:hypothetical protein CIB84_003626, partial [Bambusicola thoracicus]